MSAIVSVPIPPYNTLLAARKKYFSDTEKPSQIKERLSLAESIGFEPMSPLTGAQFSKLLPWTTRPTLHIDLIVRWPRGRTPPRQARGLASARSANSPRIFMNNGQ